jgi:hypothetical protein
MRGMTSDEIIARLGGPTAVAKLCDCSPQAVCQWIGQDPEGQQREIPKARLMYLRAIRPDAFVERRKPRKVKAEAQ